MAEKVRKVDGELLGMVIDKYLRVDCLDKDSKQKVVSMQSCHNIILFLSRRRVSLELHRHIAKIAKHLDPLSDE